MTAAPVAPGAAVADDADATAPADVCLLVEGTYPYVSGGVSSWVHDIIRGHPELSFSVLNIGSFPGSYTRRPYEVPSNVTAVHEVYCHEAKGAPLDVDGRQALEEEIVEARRRSSERRHESRMLSAIGRLHLDDDIDDDLLADLCSGDLDAAELLHGRAAFELLAELGAAVAPNAAFLDLFWHFRSIHVPVLRLLGAALPRASCYHAVSTGYAGLLGAAASYRTGRPLLLTEHGIYARERDMELSRADWIRDPDSDGAADLGIAATPSPLRGLWSRFFRALSRLAYHHAARILTLSDVNRRKQLADGAPAHKIAIVPNGVEVSAGAGAPSNPGRPVGATARVGGGRLRVGFVGRVVPIKDVITFIRACDLALRSVDLDVRLIGPQDEDGGYAGRCRELVASLGRQHAIRFVGPQPPDQIYGDLDVIVLTSFSEGQPLVILEAYAAGIPVVVTDVGACREMVEGRSAADRRLGPSGIVTRVAAPAETAAALVTLARKPALRQSMGQAGRRRVSDFYHRRGMLDAYRTLYTEMVAWPA